MINFAKIVLRRQKVGYYFNNRQSVPGLLDINYKINIQSTTTVVVCRLRHHFRSKEILFLPTFYRKEGTEQNRVSDTPRV